MIEKNTCKRQRTTQSGKSRPTSVVGNKQCHTEMTTNLLKVDRNLSEECF